MAVSNNTINGTTGNDLLTGLDGNDLIFGLGGSDTIYGGAGDDIITQSAAGTQVSDVNGGTGTDTLVFDSSAQSGGVSWFINNGTTSQGFAADYNAQEIKAALQSTSTFQLMDGDNVNLNFQGIENLSLKTGAANDLLIVRGTGDYDGGAGSDTLYADWSSATAAITWNNAASATTQSVNGSTFRNVERLLMYTGSGNDVITSTTAIANDYIDTGAGDDSVTLRTAGANVEYDQVIGGAGFDTFTFDASATTSGLFWYAYKGTATPVGFSATFEASDLKNYLDASVTSYMLASNIYGVATFSGIERFSLTGGSGDDLFLAIGNGTYNGGAGKDTFYADWSQSTSAITWVNQASATAQTANGTTVSNVERVLLYTGSGNDSVGNSYGTSSDFFQTGAGDDTVTVKAGAGFFDDVDGGAGNDTVAIDATALNTDTYWDIFKGTSSTLAVSGSSLQSIRDGLKDATRYEISSDINRLVAAKGVENVGLKTGNGSDLLIALGNVTVDGGAGTDTLYADWSASTTGIQWTNLANTTAQTVNGSTISRVERLLVQTGSGNDLIVNNVVSTSDEIMTGAGNDTIDSGNGNDTLTGGSGSDQFTFKSGATGTDTITDFALGDRLRADGFSFTTVSAGTGTGLTLGGVQVSSSGGITTVAVGTNAAAGADAFAKLTGTYTAADFAISNGNTLALTVNVPKLAVTDSAARTAVVNPGGNLALGTVITDTSGTALTWRITQADGSALPTGITYNTSTGQVQVAAGASTRQLSLSVTATNALDLSVTTTYQLTVLPADFDAVRYLAGYPDLRAAFGSSTSAATQHYVNWGAGEGRSYKAFTAMNYLASNPDLIGTISAQDDHAAAQHFVSTGAAAGRSANSFDAAAYLASHADLRAAFGKDTAAATRHFVEWGAREGRQITFKALDYIASYKDLRNAFGLDTAAATSHFLDWGAAEGRTVTFNGWRYLAGFSDLRKAFGTDTSAAARHFIQYGAGEGRDPMTFDPRVYAAMNAAARFSAGSDANALSRHFVVTGAAIGLPTTLDAASYIASYSDLRAAFGVNFAAGKDHFTNWGANEGRVVSFDPMSYIASHADLRAAFGANAQQGAAHFIQWGAAEGRAMTFDGLAYIASHADLMNAFGANARSGASHFVAWGTSEGRQVTFDATQYLQANNDLRAAFGKDLSRVQEHFIQYGRFENRATTLTAINGTATADTLTGTANANLLRGQAGNDQINGLGGNDILIGGAGADTLTGGAGADFFRYEAATEGGDQITDFTSGEDALYFKVSGFAGLSVGPVTSANFASTSAALGNSAGFVYDAASGVLRFDADGAGQQSGVIIASFGANRTLVAGDLVVGV